MKVEIKSNDKGRYSELNSKWLSENIGKSIPCKIIEPDSRYVEFANGFICHLYDCTISGN